VTDSIGASLCFDDLALVYRLGADGAATQYRITAYDAEARMLGVTALVRPDASGHACSGPLSLAPHDGYTILQIETARPGLSKQTIVRRA
jgi:hypothetical protein